MDTTSFWMTWLGIWLTIFLSITGLLIAFACGEKERIHNYIHGAPAPHPTAAAVEAARSVADFIFGDRLFHGWGFVTSVLFSFVAASTFFGIAWATTPLLRAEYIVSGHVELSATPTALTVILTAASVTLEYVFVAKSRWLLGLIRETFTTWKLLAILFGDIASTIAGFVVVTPLFLTGAALSLPWFFGTISDPAIGIEVTTPEIWVDGPLRVQWVKNSAAAYPAITSALASDVLDQVTHPLGSFHTLTIFRITGNERCAGEPPADSEPRNDCTFSAQGVEYLTATMLATAFATTLWVSFTALMLIFSRMLANSILAARHFFLWLYDHPNMMIGCWVACWPACFVSGEIIAHLILGQIG